MKDYFKRYLEGSCSEQDLRKTVSFLNCDGDENSITESMKEHWNGISDVTNSRMEQRFDNVLSHIHHSINMHKEEAPLLLKLYNGFAKIAAVLLLPLMIALAYYIVVNDAPEEDSIAILNVPNGITSDVLLPDGTRVFLNSGSTLKYPSTFIGKNARNVELIGEAYFEVVSNKQKPFVVKTNEIGVQVLGTTFNVKAYDEDPDVTVALIEGSVKLMEFNGNDVKDLVVLKPGEIADLNKKQNSLYVNYSGDLSGEVAWKNGEVVFDNESFDDVLRFMSRKYNVEYEIENKKVLEYRITAKFIHETLEEFLKKLSISSALKYEIIEPMKQTDGGYTKRKIIIK